MYNMFMDIYLYINHIVMATQNYHCGQYHMLLIPFISKCRNPKEEYKHSPAMRRGSKLLLKNFDLNIKKTVLLHIPNLQ